MVLACGKKFKFVQKIIGFAFSFSPVPLKKNGPTTAQYFCNNGRNHGQYHPRLHL